LDFWLGFDHEDPAALEQRWRRWFANDPDFDAQISARFGRLVPAAASGALASWHGASRDRLALILLLDQFPRNLFRGTREAFAHDADALALTREGVARGQDRALSPLERVFFYMPLQHAESRVAQRESVRLFDALRKEPAPARLAAALDEAARYARMHADIIARFDRFPHRNRLLGRPSTAAERAYLDGGAPTFGQ
jgi:uncharacterized protein (DUF924 family)